MTKHWGGMRMGLSLEEELAGLSERERERREGGTTDYDEATEPYLMELRKIFVRKLLATCTSFSEGIFRATISTIFIFLGSKGEEHTHTHTKSSQTADRTKTIGHSNRCFWLAEVC